MGTTTFRIVYKGRNMGETTIKVQTPIDIYIDSQTGHQFDKINPNTENYRIIHRMDYTDILEEFPDSINSSEAIKKIKKVSQKVTFDDTLIQTLIQKTQNNSRITEYQVYIVLKRNWVDPLEAPAMVTAEADTHTKMNEREDGKINMNIRSTGGKNGNMYHKSPADNLVLAQVHGHNRDQRNNYINIAGTSSVDINTASFNGFNIYSLRAYEAEVGGQAIIDKVDGKGILSLNLGATRGNPNRSFQDRKPIFNIGKDALDFWSRTTIAWEEYKKKLSKS